VSVQSLSSSALLKACRFIPSAYVHALECFIAAKQEFLSQGTSVSTKSFATLYDYQRKYVNALIKQLPPGTLYPATSRFVVMHPPTTIKSRLMRQGPFLLQPSPRVLEGSEGGDATDITYLAFGSHGDNDEEDLDGDMERLGVVLVTFQDGKVDVFLDVEKVEARWEVKGVRHVSPHCCLGVRYLIDSQQGSSRDLPMFAVYETVDLGLISNLSRISDSNSKPPLLDLLRGNHPTFLADPIHDDVVYVYHAFGVHSLHLGPMLQSLASALRAEDEDDSASLPDALGKACGTSARPILDSFSIERQSVPFLRIAVGSSDSLSR
jgi:nucleoporin NUP82